MNNKAIIEFGFRRIWRILQIKEGVIHRGRRPRWITQPCPQVFSVNGSIICSGLHFWCHFDVIGSIILDTLHFWRHWFNMAKMLSKFGEQHLVMVYYACGFNQSETGKYFEWIIIIIIDVKYTVYEIIHIFELWEKIWRHDNHHSYTHSLSTSMWSFRYSLL